MKKVIAIVQVYLLTLAVLALVTVTVASALERPIRQDEKLGDKPEYEGATVITSGTNLASTTYTSTEDEQIALYITGGNSSIASPTVIKSGTGYHGWVNFGSNAGILVRNGASVSIKDGSVATSGNYSPGIFVDASTLRLQNTAISTSGDYSTGLAATASANVTAVNASVSTKGTQSFAVRSISGGSLLNLSGGEYTTSGTLSPAIYALSRIAITGGTFTAQKSESLIIEGANSVSIDGTTLTSTNAGSYTGTTERSGIFLYQPTSTHDAPVGTTTFTAQNSTITANAGSAIFVTNANANLTLENNEIANDNGAFLRAEASNWGEAGANGGNVTLTMKNQSVKGDLIVDDISKLNLSLSDSSSITGAINHANASQNITLTLSADSILTLTGNSYITSLKNEDPDNYNIRLNGYTLEVNGVVLTSTYRGNIVVDDDYDPFEPVAAPEDDFLSSIPVWVLPVSIVVSIFIFAGLAGFIVYRIQKKDSANPAQAQADSAQPQASAEPSSEATPVNATNLPPAAQTAQPPLPPQTSPDYTNSAQPPAPPVPPSTPLSA